MDTPERAKRVPVIRRADWSADLEEYSGMIFCHVWVHGKFNHRVFREMKRDCEVLFEMGGQPWYAFSHHPHNEDRLKQDKFVRKFGFEFNCMITCTDHVVRPVYTRWR